MKIAISSGHGLKVRGARGNPCPPQHDEVDQVRRIVNRIAEIWKAMTPPVGVAVFHDDKSTSQNQNLQSICNWHNAQQRDYDVSCHLNAFDHSAHGTEVLYKTQQTLATKVSSAIASAGGFHNRGAKLRNDLSFLNSTTKPAILLETYFCDNTSDCNKADAKFELICQSIAASISGQSVSATPPPLEPAPPTQPTNPTDVPIETRSTISKGDEGDDVYDMQALIPGFDGIVDGDFGPITEEQLIAYQATRGLAADGICGPKTWGALYANTPPLPPPPHALSEEDIVSISYIATTSQIASYAWADRGIAPTGYMEGMACAFAQTLRKLKQGHPAAVEMSKKRASSDKDALHIYQAEFRALDMDNETAGVDTLRHLYALMLGHGMRESSGRHCEGRDQSATNVQSETAESGLFQTSYNAHSASDPEFGALMTEYSNPANQQTCYLAEFEDGVSCSEQEWGCYGSGSGYAFQDLCKRCPAFAVETCGLTLRNLCNHYGPIIRKETELKAAAEDMFRQVQEYIENQEAVA